MRDHCRAVVIGAGQAGLAAAKTLLDEGLGHDEFLVLDSGAGPGGAWRERWDSLTLGRAHGIADLPGLAMGTPDPDVPASTLVAEYYGAYEERFALDVIRPAEVTSVTSPEAARSGPLLVAFDLDGQRREVTTEVLLNATGTWRNPFVPWIPGLDSFRGRVLHTVGYGRAEDFAGKRVLVVGGGLSAVQFLLELGPVTDTLWSTRRPPNFTGRTFDGEWGVGVERAVRERTHAGKATASVVRTTGIPLWEPYLEAVRTGVLVSGGALSRVDEGDVVFGEPASDSADGLGPSAAQDLVLPESWRPFPPGHRERVDVIFFNTGFRPVLQHLAPLKLRSRHGGVEMASEVEVAVDDRVLLVGYGSTASTVGATRAGRRAGRVAARRLRR